MIVFVILNAFLNTFQWLRTEAYMMIPKPEDMRVK